MDKMTLVQESEIVKSLEAMEQFYKNLNWDFETQFLFLKLVTRGLIDINSCLKLFQSPLRDSLKTSINTSRMKIVLDEIFIETISGKINNFPKLLQHKLEKKKYANEEEKNVIDVKKKE